MNSFIDQNKYIHYSIMDPFIDQNNPFIGAGKSILEIVKPKQMNYSSYEVISNGSGGSVAGWDGRVVIVT